MTTQSTEPNGREQRLDEVIAAYLQEVEAGRRPDRRALLEQHPDLDEELAEFFADEDRFDRVVAPLAALAPPAAPAGDTATEAACDGTGSTAPDWWSELGPLSEWEEIAHGGMGVVYRCRDRALGRDLAVKVLHERYRGCADMVRRFIEEAQVCGQLTHPGVVPVYGLGRLADGRPFFTMKLVEGRTLQELLAARATPAGELHRYLQVFEQMAQAVAYAHSRGVWHRDLKPLNVMVGAFGEVQVMDWGLARVLNRDSHPAAADSSSLHTVRSKEAEQASQAGTVLGTPAYMAPEQARGEIDWVDQRADVFGLGAILCEILTG